MVGERYTVAGWLAIISAALVPPTGVLALLYDMNPSSRFGLLPLIVLLSLAGAAFSLYALYRLRHLLNHRYGFHDADTPVTILICGGIVMAVIGNAARPLGVLGLVAMIPLLLLIVAIGIPLAVVGIVFAVRLLRLEADLNGFQKPLAYTHLIASICFITVILAPLGLLAMLIFEILLGLAFLRADHAESELGFV